MAGSKIVECVPNFSEGRDRAIIDSIARAISGTVGVSLLDVDPGADTNRTVYTFVGEPDAVAEGALAAARAARALIDMTRHSGAHPRMGALDVCPFVPVSGTTMEECVALSRRVGEAMAAELGVPVYLYEQAATRPERRSLADIRAGEYEALAEKLLKSEWAPDFGPAAFVPRWGATAVGAREFLIAYNVNLNARDKKIANEVALSIREGGRAAKDASGNPLLDAEGKPMKLPGRLKDVRAIGWYIDAYKCAQVSVNLVNYRTTPLHAVFEAAKEEAEKIGALVTGSEIVGLVPLEPLVQAGRHFLRNMGRSEGASEAELVDTAIRSLGLSSVAPFDPAKKIIDWACRPAAPLASMKVSDFADEVAGDSPAPGGGSVSALAGSLGAALGAMAANLTVAKKGYEASWRRMSELAVEGQRLKAALLRAVDEDSAAFNEVMDAMKLPKASAEQREARERALGEANKKAALVPLETARTCLAAVRLCAAVAVDGNANSISDAGVGALMARAGVEGSALNVKINLGAISDAALASSLASESDTLVAEVRAACDGALATVAARMSARASAG
jgi:glutamate formiminotransferase/formiminotetrahydrofolate cyclodeaminase